MNYLGESKIGLTQKTIKTAVFMSKTAVLCVMREQFRYTLEIGKNESWSGFELFQLYFFRYRLLIVTDNWVIFKSDQNRYSLTYLNFDSFHFNISHPPISEAGATGFKNRNLFRFLALATTPQKHEYFLHAYRTLE